MKGLRAVWLAVFVIAATLTHAQNPVIATLTADSNQILIGDHLHIRLAVKHPKSFKIFMPNLKDSIGNMDFISASKIDTIQQPTDEVYAQTYQVSAFDSGQFHAGPITVFFKNADGSVDSTVSNVISIRVNTIPVDTVKPFKAIKAPIEIPYSWREFLPYIIGVVVLTILILVGLYLYSKYRKVPVVADARPRPKDPPHIWARKELKKLEEEKIWQKGETKLYYSRLTDILRLYLEFRFKWLALESTTEEIETAMQQYNLKEKAKGYLLEILRLADLVKFAKMMPAPDNNIKAMESAYKFIDFTEPKEEELLKAN